MTVDQALLRKLFDYDPHTGVVTRLVCTANRHTPGEQVGYLAARGYLQAGVFATKYYLHRLIWMWVYGTWPVNKIDHVNRVRSDNRLINLREVSNAENCHNTSRQTRNWSGYTGVAWDKNRCLWLAQITVSGRHFHLGRYSTPAEASVAYQAAKAIHHPTAPKATS